MRLLFCSPDYFDVPEIDEDNRHMDPERPPFLDLAMKQHRRLVSLCSALLGRCQESIRPRSGLVDMTFTRNGYFPYGPNEAILARFKPLRRRAESAHYRDFLLGYRLTRGYHVYELPEGVFFEGGGDAALYKDKIICGYGMRTSREALPHIERITGMEVVPVELVRPPGRELAFYHRDTMSIFLEDAETAIVYPEATTLDSLRRLATFCTVIRASRADAENMALNAIVIPRRDLCLEGYYPPGGPEVDEEVRKLRLAFKRTPTLRGAIIISDTASEALLTILERLRYYPITLPLSEFLKSGAGPYCLSNDI
ncbi:MAG: hypothetical protein HY457_03270 [Parcubacteria group bacterium]|nr:hypothetical protein [Parcubacteria group bacterium]